MVRLHPFRSQGHRTKRGALALEMVVCVGLFFTLLAGLIQFGMILHATSTLAQYSREGARYTASNWGSIGFNGISSSYASNSGTFAYYMNYAESSKNIPYSKTTVTLAKQVYNSTTQTYVWTNISDSSCTSNCTLINKGDVVRVRVSYDMTKQYVFSKIVGMPTTWTYNSDSYMVAE